MKKEKVTLSYKKAGVDIGAGDRFVEMIGPLARKTFRPEVAGDIGSFGAFFRLDTKKYKEPLLVSGTDGVGTKLKIAFLTGRHDTVGIDLVAMCVNDILTGGAEPLFFLDYLATGRLRPRKAAEVVKGIAAGCREAGCALIGGETAEMPGFYARDEYDLAGFAVGVVDRRKVISGSRIRHGDAVVGLASSGIHSNGYSLVRKVFFDTHRMSVRRFVPSLKTTLGEALLRPTRIYVKAYNALKGRVDVKGMAHITGGGIPGNLPRVLPPGLGAVVDRGAWEVPPVFRTLQEAGRVDRFEMDRVFNMGIGMVVVVHPDDAEDVAGAVRAADMEVWSVGNVESGQGVRYLG